MNGLNFKSTDWGKPISLLVFSESHMSTWIDCKWWFFVEDAPNSFLTPGQCHISLLFFFTFSDWNKRFIVCFITFYFWWLWDLEVEANWNDFDAGHKIQEMILMVSSVLSSSLYVVFMLSDGSCLCRFLEVTFFFFSSVALLGFLVLWFSR